MPGPAINTTTSAAFGTPYSFQGTENRIGWTAGAGVEWAFSDDWSVNVEYDYIGFGHGNVMHYRYTISGVTGQVNIKQNIQLIKLGVNFHVYGRPIGEDRAQCTHCEDDGVSMRQSQASRACSD